MGMGDKRVPFCLTAALLDGEIALFPATEKGVSKEAADGADRDRQAHAHASTVNT